MSTQKYALFAFNGDPMCFIHVLLNGIEFKEKGHEVQIIMEGSATKLVRDLNGEGSTPSHTMYRKAREMGLIAGACKACSNQMGVLEDVKEQEIPFRDEMHGHPSIPQFREEGWEVITF
ncbi:DsrE family protein [Salinispira pacifica]|uniref:Cytoplasmic protein n=1 Tax=Salinispira pacifica TaxID=1307761 RepID=V5WNS5_9SPIO|nr:DsrE family protein [Salinispira pacifica]AHC16741.1 hypothetical protein L21SP2_3403 [Salinispira pacifica]